jgi:hypothetical protein
MYEPTINEVLKQDKISSKTFLGVFARDEIPKFINYPACFVMNTENRNKPGQHWLALHYDKKGRCYFFDSYGNQPKHHNLQNYIEKTSKSWTYNKRRLQGFSEYCGFYCLLFLLFKTRDQPQQYFKKFTLDYIKNDKLIENEIKIRTKLLLNK